MPFIPWNSQPLQDWAAKYASGSFMELAGHSTHYVVRGAGDPVLLLHGFFYDSFMWHNNIGPLAEVFKVYALDLWGFGYSTRAPMEYGYNLYSRQLLDFMDALGIHRASMVGQSMGGGTILKFAVHHPDRVDKVILIDPAGMPNPLPLMGRIANLPLVGELMYGLQSDFTRRLALKRNFIHQSAFITDSYFENVTRFHKVKGTSEVMLAILRKRFFDTLYDDILEYARTEIPTLLVWGREDTSIPLVHGNAMHALLPGSRLQVIDAAGHCPHDEQSDQFNSLATSFLTGIPEAA